MRGWLSSPHYESLYCGTSTRDKANCQIYSWTADTQVVAIVRSWTDANAFWQLTTILIDTSDIHTRQAVEPELVLQPVSIVYHHKQGDWEIGYTTTGRKQPLHDGQLPRARYKADCLAALLRSINAVPKCLIRDMEVLPWLLHVSFLALLVLFWLLVRTV